MDQFRKGDATAIWIWVKPSWIADGNLKKRVPQGTRRPRLIERGQGQGNGKGDYGWITRGSDTSEVVVIPSLRLYILLNLCSISVVRSGQIRFILSVERLKGANGSRKWFYSDY